MGRPLTFVVFVSARAAAALEQEASLHVKVTERTVPDWLTLLAEEYADTIGPACQLSGDRPIRLEIELGNAARLLDSRYPPDLSLSERLALLAEDAADREDRLLAKEAQYRSRVRLYKTLNLPFPDDQDDDTPW